jgi:hypothetical protein
MNMSAAVAGLSRLTRIAAARLAEAARLLIGRLAWVTATGLARLPAEAATLRRSTAGAANPANSAVTTALLRAVPRLVTLRGRLLLLARRTAAITLTRRLRVTRSAAQVRRLARGIARRSAARHLRGLALAASRRVSRRRAVKLAAAIGAAAGAAALADTERNGDLVGHPVAGIGGERRARRE